MAGTRQLFERLLAEGGRRPQHFPAVSRRLLMLCAQPYATTTIPILIVIASFNVADVFTIKRSYGQH